MKNNSLQIVMVVLVCFLFVFTVGQTVAISKIQNNMATGNVVGSAPPASYPTSAPVASAPTMVGGC